MDSQHPHTWDSDVVIEINVQYSNGGTFGSKKEEFLHMDDSEHKESRSKDASLDKIKDVRCSCIVGAVESSMNSQFQILIRGCWILIIISKMRAWILVDISK